MKVEERIRIFREASNRYARTHSDEDLKIMQEQYHKIAMATDRQMLRIERLASQGKLAQDAESGSKSAKRALTKYQKSLPKGEVAKDAIYYANVDKYAYANAKNALERMQLTKLDQKAVLADVRKMRIAVNIASNYINSPTATKGKIKDIYVRRTKTLNKNLGTDFKWQDLANFLESEAFQKLKSQNYSSDTIFKAAGAILKYKDKPEQIEAFKSGSSHITMIPDDEVENRMAEKIVQSGIFDELLE